MDHILNNFLIVCLSAVSFCNQLQPHIDKFMEEALINNVTIPRRHLFIKRLDKEEIWEGKPHVIGLCQINDHDPKYVVTIKGSYWDSASMAQREILIYHELGHCVLDKRHCATGIMEPTTTPFMEIRWERDRPRWLKQFFSRCDVEVAP